VNLASRLVAAANPGEILVGLETAELIAPDFEVRDRGRIEFKGIGSTPVFELVGRRTHGDRERARLV
jgi:class 3 adenylate cyclase